MKTCIAIVVMIVTTVAQTFSGTETGNALKTENGNCAGTNTTFRERHWVDLDNDGKADHTVTVWCNKAVSTNPVGLVSGSWPTSHDSWTANLEYQTVSQDGRYHYAFIYRDNATHAVIGSEVLDSLDPTSSAAVAFYSSLPMIPTVSDRENQAPVGMISDVDKSLTTLTFEAYEQGLYTVTVRLRRENGDEVEREIHMYVNQIGQMTIPCQLRSGETVYGFRLDRPNRGGHETHFK
jgi:hypothetical protein